MKFAEILGEDYKKYVTREDWLFFVVFSYEDVDPVAIEDWDDDCLGWFWLNMKEKKAFFRSKSDMWLGSPQNDINEWQPLHPIVFSIAAELIDEKIPIKHAVCREQNEYPSRNADKA